MAILKACHHFIMFIAWSVAATAVVGFDSWETGDGCTSIIVGPGGTVEGGTMTTHTDDCFDCDFRISKVPAADHPEGSQRPIQRYRAQYPRYVGYARGETYYPENTDMSIHEWTAGEGDFEPIGYIPQVPHTYSYVDGGYGIMNEFQVSIGESTCGAVLATLPVHLGGHALLEAAELSRIALERCKTARCAVETMGMLAVEYGFYGADPTMAEGGESLQVVDPTEAWMFHIIADDTGTSAVWVAQRVPSGHIAAVANQFVIRYVYLNDTANFLGSENLLEVAVRAGVWDPQADGEIVDYTRAFAMDRGHLSPYATRRQWRVLSLAAPSLALPSETNTLADDYPFSVAVDAPLSAQDVMAMNRDHYEGTAFDMTHGLAAGPYGDPSRFDPASTLGLEENYGAGETIDQEVSWSGNFERAISIYRCAYSWVSQARPHVENGLGVVWFGQYAPHASQYVPIYVGGSKVPAAFSKGSLFKFDPTVSYWIHAAIGNWADRFHVHTLGDIQFKQKELDNAFSVAQQGVEVDAGQMLRSELPTDAAALLDEAMDDASMNDLDEWGNFLYVLIAKFKDGQRIEGPPGKITYSERITPTKLFYPKWWLEAVGFFHDDDALLSGAALQDALTPAFKRLSNLGVLLALLVSHGVVAVGVALALRPSKVGETSGNNRGDGVETKKLGLSVTHFTEIGSSPNMLKKTKWSRVMDDRGGYRTIPTNFDAVEMIPCRPQGYQQQKNRIIV